LKQDYIDNGNIKYYHKDYITFEDIDEKSRNYRYSMALLCVGKLNKENYYKFYFNLFDTKEEDIRKLIKKYGIQEKEFDKCLRNKDYVNLMYKNALEIEKLDMIGVNQRIYIGIAGNDNTILTGIPKYSRFQDVIRLYEIQIGN